MNKTFIFLPNNLENNFLISCAKFGVNHFGTIFLSPNKLIKDILYFDNYKVIDSFYNLYIIYEIAKKVPYFANINFIDTKDIYQAICTIDGLLKDNKYLDIFVEKAEFKEKNSAIKSVYDTYHQFLRESNLDNEITLLNKALSKTKLIGDEVLVFKEFPLTYLEQKLLSSCFSSIKELGIKEYLTNNQAYKVDSYVSSYGMEIEIEYLLSYINEHNYLYEDTNLVIFDQKYLTYLNTYQNLHGLKLACNLKKALSESNPFKLFDLLYRYQQKDFFSYTALKNIFNSDCFDKQRFKEVFDYNDADLKRFADLKIAFGNYDNIVRFKTIAKEDEAIKVDAFYNVFNNYYQIINDYSIISNSFDQQAKDLILNLFDSIDTYQMNIDMDSIYDYLLNMSISIKQNDINALQVMDLKSALTSLNKHLFIVGLNAKSFPGSSVENHLLLDNDLKLFENTYAKYSYSKVDENKTLLDEVISLYSAIGSDIHISYYDFDLEQLKKENPSSALFEIYKKQNPDASLTDLEKKIKNVGYTDFLCSKNKNLISLYLDNNIIKPKELSLDSYGPISLNRALSPTSLEKYFTCPYYFYLRYILNLNEEEKDDPLVLIDEASLGTMVHSCMEKMSKFSNKDELMSYANQLFDEYLIQRVPISTSLIEDKRKDYLRMVENGFVNDPHNEVISSELYLEFTCLNLKFKGFIDRVERISDGTYIIVDYKTYADIKNISNDINTCLQIVLYAYGLRQNGYDVRRCEYRYLNNSRVVVVDYDEDIEAKLLSKVQHFKDSLQSGKFDYAIEDYSCRYCSYSFFCQKKENENEQESD